MAMRHIAARIPVTLLHFGSAVSHWLNFINSILENQSNIAFVPGTSIAVYGLLSWNNIGSLSATYSIDGTPHPSSFSVTTSSPNYLHHTGEVTNQLYFSLDSLSP